MLWPRPQRSRQRAGPAGTPAGDQHGPAQWRPHHGGSGYRHRTAYRLVRAPPADVAALYLHPGLPGRHRSEADPGVFWESPDVYIEPGVAPAAAPDVPAQLGQIALANQDNTVYAHVWNLGRAPAREVVVQFYWCNPALGFNPVGATQIGTTFTTLGARGSGCCHAVVKCPVSWVPSFVNGGHECLLVRAWDVAADPMTTPEWDASQNRSAWERREASLTRRVSTSPAKTSR